MTVTSTVIRPVSMRGYSIRMLAAFVDAVALAESTAPSINPFSISSPFDNYVEYTNGFKIGTPVDSK